MRIEALDFIQKNDMILFYPYNYEGMECIENVIYVGVPFSGRVFYFYFIRKNLNIKY